MTPVNRNIRPLDRIVVVAGPTAGGKSELAVAIARRFRGEIINADSMQIYRQLNAGTAKPTPAQRAAAAHHLIDIVDAADRFTVADWIALAEPLIAKLQQTGKLPIVVGGTNLYLKSLLEGMFEGPPADDALRAELALISPVELHARLVAVDPDAAARIDKQDHRRIVRALEVHRATGKPISEHQREWIETPDKPYRHNPILLALNWSVEAINRRINARVKMMFTPSGDSEDLITETRRLLEGDALGPQAKEAIGTKQVLDHFAGKYTLEEALERVKIDTRRFAKSQRTWLKRYRHVHWLDVDKLTPEELAAAAIEVIEREII